MLFPIYIYLQHSVLHHYIISKARKFITEEEHLLGLCWGQHCHVLPLLPIPSGSGLFEGGFRSLG